MLVSQAHRKNCTRNRLYCQRRGVRDVDPGNTKKNILRRDIVQSQVGVD